MRFVFVSSMSGFAWGGSEELWSRSALRLHEQGHAVKASFLWWPAQSDKLEKLAAGGVEIRVRQKPGLQMKLRSKLEKHLKLQDSEFSWLERQRPDLVIISQGGNLDGLEWMKFCRTANLPYVCIVQANHEGWWPSDNMEATFAYEGARKVFCVSRHNLKLLEYQLAKNLVQAEVVWNPWNLGVPGALDWPKESSTWKLACIARLDPGAKGQDLLLQVMSERRWQERPIEVNFFGEGPSKAGLTRLAELLGVKNCHFRGHMSNMGKIWEESHLLVLPSRYEGLPLALIESMWCGRPAVVTNIGGNAEMCVDGKTGFIAEAPTAKLLDETLERAWNARNDWQQMGLAARERVQQLVPQDPIGEFCKKLTACL